MSKEEDEYYERREYEKHMEREAEKALLDSPECALEQAIQTIADLQRQLDNANRKIALLRRRWANAQLLIAEPEFVREFMEAVERIKERTGDDKPM